MNRRVIYVDPSNTLHEMVKGGGCEECTLENFCDNANGNDEHLYTFCKASAEIIFGLLAYRKFIKVTA